MSQPSRSTDMTCGLDLLVVPTAADDADVVGFHPVPGRLPAVHRFPGESLAQLIHRTLALATGAGPFLAYPAIKGHTHADS
jgi:hypothetical protein